MRLLSKKKLVLIVSWFVLILLSGCETLKHSGTTERDSLLLNQKNWSLMARIAVNTKDSGLSATLNWQQNDQNFDFHIYGLLGVTYAHLVQTENIATLKLKDNKSFQAETAEQLLQQNLGWHFPIEALSYWVKGIAYDYPGEVISYDNDRKISSIQFEGWQVAFSQFKNYSGYSMPRIIKASNPEHGSIKIVVKKWLFKPNL